MLGSQPKIEHVLGMAACLALVLVSVGVRADEPFALEPVDGYRGIWYYNQPSNDEYRYKYSGGFATYPQQHIPIAIHAPEVNKTFFVYGGTVEDKRELLHMVSYFDHETGEVPRPRLLLNKQTSDAHDNPTFSIDTNGYLWIFSNAHGTSRPSFIHRSTKPYDIVEFELIKTTNFSYGQPWHVPEHGFLFLHTRYSEGRKLFWMTSPDGRDWSAPVNLAAIDQGHYQISWREGPRVGTALNYHPKPVGLNARTNLYYLQTDDFGRAWTNAAGEVVPVPLTDPDNAALVHDYQSENLLVYLKDIQFDAEGHPVLLYLTTLGFESGPENDPRTWNTARWNGSEWEIRPITTSDHNYDLGSLYLEPEGTWRLIAPTDPGPQPYGTGGEIVMWTSDDQGRTWTRVKALTTDSEFNHTYVRRPFNAHPDFYGFWADGSAWEPSVSRLYFCNRDGQVVQLPETMTEQTARPDPLP